MSERTANDYLNQVLQRMYAEAGERMRAEPTPAHSVSLDLNRASRQRPPRQAASVESYMHKFAKATLAGWLRDWASRSTDCGYLPDEYRGWGAPSWRVNRGAPTYGVWEEYPICESLGTASVWDEQAWAAELNLPECTEWERPPTYDECIKLKMPPLAILDIAVQHKGAILHGFEVVHRHGITPLKLQRLTRIARRDHLELYTVPAHWILCQVGMPERLVSERVL